MANKLLLGTMELEIESGSKEPAINDAKAGRLALAKEKPEPWFELPGPPKTWQFAFVSAELLTYLNDDEECYALTLPSLGLVLFESGLKLRKNRGQLEVVFGHELVHVGLNTDGGSHTLKQALGAKTDKTANDREEAICGLWSNNAAPSLFRCGVLRLPRFPRGR